MYSAGFFLVQIIFLKCLKSVLKHVKWENNCAAKCLDANFEIKISVRKQLI